MSLYEVLTSASSHADAARAMLYHTDAAGLLRGAVWTRENDGGWVRPSRVGPVQARALESCLAWHPGLFRQMARTTAGICLRFATDGTEVAVSVRLDDEPSGTADVLAPLDKGRRRPHDGFSAIADGRALACVMPQTVGRALPWMDDAEGPGAGIGIVSFSLERHSWRGAGTMAIPGLGARHEVCLWLPCLRGCEVRDVWSDGTYIEPLPERPHLLVLGDSLGQGFCADDPLLAWPSLLAAHLSLELVNQSIGGQVFQPSALMGESVEEVSTIVIELGNNYRHEACTVAEVTRDVRAYLREVVRAYPTARVVVVTPTGHDEDAWPVHPRSCAREVPAIVRAAARKLGLHVIDGTRLIERGDVVLSDGEHPSAAGHVQMAARLAVMLEGGA
ncbi:MAG: SGNH/GDSL hydrolase family protein [Atopobiaceae bacterium]|nr:SGNH/GDSL hydrolase family protein [Atopobiaceae bacterium]